MNVTFWTYLIRQGKNGFRRQSSNIVLLLVTGILIFITSLTIKFVGSVDQGWTICPLLSSSPTKIPDKIYDHLRNQFLRSSVRAISNWGPGTNWNRAPNLPAAGRAMARANSLIRLYFLTLITTFPFARPAST